MISTQNNKRMKVIITGSSGMVGKAVLLECLNDPIIESVLLINRSSIEMEHPKIKEVLLPDFTHIDRIKDQFAGYDACFYCMGVSSFRMSEKDYNQVTFAVTEKFAKTLVETNTNMVFNYVSGMGTDSTEKGSVMWARIKGKTENMVLDMGFKDAYAFRPGVILPEKGVRSKTRLYNFFYIVLKPLFPLLRAMSNVIMSSGIGKAMINTLQQPQEYKILEAHDIKLLAKK